MENADKDNIEQIKNILRSRLQQSGVNNLIRHMVRDVCTAQNETEDIDPDYILQELYDKGLMKTVLDSVEWPDNMRKNLPENVEPERLGSTSVPKEKESHVGSQVVDNILKPGTGRDGGHEFEESSGNFESDVDSEEEKVDRKASDHRPTTGPAPVLHEVPHTRQTTGRLNGKYFLKLEVLEGRNFLDQLFDSGQTPHDKSTFVLHISYMGQRFYSQPTPAQCQPKIQDTFMIDIGYFENGSVLQILTKYEPIHAILLQETAIASGERKLLSSCLIDWRSQLMSQKSSTKIPVTLMGIGPEFQVPIGILSCRMTIVPSLEEILSPATYAAQVNAERSIQDEKERLFLIYVKQWWREFIEIRPQHSKRNVKIFSYDENTTPRPIQTFVKPIVADRLLLTPCHAAWFVSLITLLDNDSEENYCQNFQSSAPSNQGSPQVLCSHWQSLIATLTAKSGRVEDHATLLCSLLLGFGLDAYVAIGTKNSGASWVWVVTFEEENNAIFWESTNGKRYSHTSIPSAEILVDKLARLSHSTGTEKHDLKTISCLFNNCVLYANIQNTAFLDVVDWNVSNPSKWKKIPESTLKSSSKFNEMAPNLMPATKNPILVSSDIEIQIKTLISEYRLQYNLRTCWDTRLSLILGQELARYELQDSLGAPSLTGFFHAAILKNIPGGYEFKGYPWHGNMENPTQIFHLLKRNPKCQEVMLCRGSDVQLAIRVQTFTYPENVISVRLMIASKFVPAG